jgi:hypothetical protein
VTGRKMHAEEVDLDVSLVVRLLAAQVPQWAELTLEVRNAAAKREQMCALLWRRADVLGLEHQMFGATCADNEVARAGIAMTTRPSSARSRASHRRSVRRPTRVQIRGPLAALDGLPPGPRGVLAVHRPGRRRRG